MIGYKFIGKAHSHAYRDLSLFIPNTFHPEMKVICGRDQNGVAAAAKQFGWEEYTTDWKSLLERDDIDLIDINAPSDVHKEITIAAAQAGKHVFCEKPLALTLKDSREMLEVVETAGVKHMVGFNYRFAPAVMLAKKLLEEGKLGDVYHFRRTGSSIQTSPASGDFRRILLVQVLMEILGPILSIWLTISLVILQRLLE